MRPITELYSTINYNKANPTDPQKSTSWAIVVPGFGNSLSDEILKLSVINTVHSSFSLSSLS